MADAGQKKKRSTCSRQGSDCVTGQSSSSAVPNSATPLNLSAPSATGAKPKPKTKAKADERSLQGSTTSALLPEVDDAGSAAKGKNSSKDKGKDKSSLTDKGKEKSNSTEKGKSKQPKVDKASSSVTYDDAAAAGKSDKDKSSLMDKGKDKSNQTDKGKSKQLKVDKVSSSVTNRPNDATAAAVKSEIGSQDEIVKGEKTASIAACTKSETSSKNNIERNQKSRKDGKPETTEKEEGVTKSEKASDAKKSLVAKKGESAADKLKPEKPSETRQKTDDKTALYVQNQDGKKECEARGGNKTAKVKKAPSSLVGETDSGDDSLFKSRSEKEKDQILWRRYEDLVVKKEDSQEGGELLKEVISVVTDTLKSSGLKWEQINSGSSYEKLKISKLHDYDVMYVLKDVRAETVYELDAGIEKYFCKVKAKDSRVNKLFASNNLDPSVSYISPKLLLDYFRDNVEKAVEKMSTNENMTVSSKEWNGRSPAVTLVVKSPSNIKFDVDLVPAVRIFEWPRPAISFLTKKDWFGEPLMTRFKKPDESHLFPLAIPKIHVTERRKSMNNCYLFRISFSQQEKEILLHADGNLNPASSQKKVKTCRKKVIKLLKEDLDQLGPVNKNNDEKILCSYHLKTIMLNLFDDRYRPEDWENKPEILRKRYVDGLRKLVDCLNVWTILHYFILDQNLLNSNDRRGKDAMITHFNGRIAEFE